MELKMKCAVVRDLLPNYIEKLTSQETNQEIEEHLQNCEPCTKVYEEMRTEVSGEKDSKEFMTEAKNLSKFLRKTKVMSALKTMWISMLTLGIIVNVIVDLAINKKITWSIIVIASVVFTVCISALLIWGGKNRIIKALACLSVLVLPLLYVISTYSRLYSTGQDWFLKYAVPIALIWIVFLWLGVFMFKVCKCSFWVMLGIEMILAIAGNLFTNAVANQASIHVQMQSLDSIINSCAFAAAAAVCFVVASIRKGKRI